MARKTASKNTDKLILEAEVRHALGKKVRKLRHTGFIPAAIYGPDFKSQSIQVKTKDFLQTYKIVHETGILFVKYDSAEVPVLIKNLQRHPINDSILHVDFRKIDLKQKIQTTVPLKIIGLSEAVNKKGGVLLTHLESIQIEALPTNIPQNIQVDIKSLNEIGQEIKISDLAKSEKFEIKDPVDRVIISVIAHKEESVTPETAAPVTEVTTEKKEEEVQEAAVKEETQKPAKEEQAKKEPPKAEEKKK